MKKDRKILEQIERHAGMNVPEGYFEDFTSRMIAQLGELEEIKIQKVTVWERVRPWLYMAAMFGGIALMLRLFVPKEETSSVAEENVITNENVEDYLFYSNVDEYSVYEYLALGE